MADHDLSKSAMFGILILFIIGLFISGVIFMFKRFWSLVSSEMRFTFSEVCLRLIVLACISYLVLWIELPFLKSFVLPSEIEMPLVIFSVVLLMFLYWTMLVKDLAEMLERMEHRVIQERLSGKSKK